jgi:hypothetical protein
MKVDWTGVYPAAVTHFHQDESLDLPATMSHLEKMIDAGIHGVIMLGTVGENCSLSYDEKLQVLRATVEHVNGRIPVLTGVAECSTKLACHFAADSQTAGVDGMMVLPAMVYKSDPRKPSLTSARWPVPRICRSCATTIRSLMGSILPPRCSPIWLTKRNLSPSRNPRKTHVGSPIFVMPAATDIRFCVALMIW